MTFFALSLLTYGGLVAWLSERLAGTPAEWGYTFGHMALAAAINAHLLWVARRRNLSFLGSAPLGFLVVLHVYFTVAGLKYFSPILLYPQFDLTLHAQFVGSVAGAAVLFCCGLVLHGQNGPTRDRVQAWVGAYWGDIRRLMVMSVVGSVLCKVALYQLGYGSMYTDSAYNEHAVRNYGDYFILLGNDMFGVLSVVFGLIFLLRRRIGHGRPVTALLALVGILLQVVYVLLYLKARMILLTTGVTMALAAEVVSRRRAERLLQALLLVFPALSLLGIQLTLLIGRFNVPEDTGLRLAIAAVNRRADLTDFPTAMIVQSRGKAYDPRIVSAALLNAIPRAVFPGKQDIVKDVYTEILEQKLAWPAGAAEDMQADYLDTPFSNGVMSFGAVGFLLVPLGLTALFGWLASVLERSFRGLAYGLALIPLWLAGMHIEGEWASIPLNLRQAVSYAVLCMVLALTGRLVHQILVVASLPPPPHAGGVRALPVPRT